MEMLDIEVFEGGFKETELGPLPEEWEVVRLGDVVDLDRGISWRKFEEGNKDNGHLIISIPNIKDGYIDFNSKYNRYLNKHIPKNKQIQLNDILFVGSSGSIENVGRNVFIENLPFEGIGFASFVFRTRVKINSIIPKFLYFMANSHWFNYKDYVRRSSDGKYNLQLTEFKSMKIPLPPLEEQKAIAGILSTVQSAIEKTEKVINALKNLKKSMMKHLFTYGPVAEEEAEKVELKETEIGLIPKHWEVVRVGEVVKIIKGKKPKTLSESPSKNSLPYLTAEYFRYGVPKQFVDIEVEKDLPVCKKEDVVLIWDGSKAGQVFTGLEGVLASTMVKIIPTINNLDKLYLYCFLTTKFDYLNSQTMGSTIPHVNKTAFFNLPLPLPPLEEQQKIAQILQSIDQRIEKEEKYKNALQNLFKSLLHNLMTSKIRVRVKSHGED